MSKIVWSKALADYLRNETQSYASIAVKHGVSLQSVKKRAAKEGWSNLRQRSIQKVNQELPKMIGESVAEVNARHIRFARTLQEVGLKAIEEGESQPTTPLQALQSVKTGIEIERKALGMNNLENRDNKPDIKDIIEADRKKYRS